MAGAPGLIMANSPSSESLEELTRPFLKMLQAMTGLDSVYLTEIHWEGADQEILYALNTGPLDIAEGLHVPWEETVCRRALLGASRNTSDVPTVYADSKAAQDLRLQTYVTCPVITPEPRKAFFGTLCGASASVVAVDESAMTAMRHVAGLIGERVALEQSLRASEAEAAEAEAERDAMTRLAGELTLEAENREEAARTFELRSEELARLSAELYDLSVSDPLTGVLNRRGFERRWKEEVAAADRYQYPLSVASIDLDGFKAVNDTCGHAFGDIVIKMVTESIREHIREVDFIARIGGDEFIVGFPHTDVMAVDLVCSRIRESFNAIDFGGGVRPSGFSVGIACSATTPAADVLEAADRALYTAKRQGRGKNQAHHGALTY
ncbi:MAG: GGDEF domain-containing protein [Candidatus Dormibacteria bacterium]